MADTTSRYSFPYQEAADAPDGPALGQDLAEAVEVSLGALEDRVDDQFAWIAQQRFTSNGSFTKATYAGARKVRVRVVGGGGAGGGAAATGAATVSAGSGGQGGGYAESWLDASALASSVTVTIGAGGTGVSGGTGNNGGNSSFGAHVVANGGAGGATVGAGGTLFPIAGGGGAQTVTGDITRPGSPGAPGIRLGSLANQVLAGNGGESMLGPGGLAGFAASTSGYGGGGGGRANTVSASAGAGFAGAAGIVIVDVYA
jgi:hypothetical protein